MEPFTIYPATEEDVPTLLELIRELAEFERLAHEVESNADLLRAAMFGERPVAAALVARAGGVAVGYAIYYRTFSTFTGRLGIFLEDLYVRPDYRKCGLGRALLTKVAAAGQKLGGGRMEWNALRWNENALSFYRGLGAKTLDEWVMLRMTGGEVRSLLGGDECEG